MLSKNEHHIIAISDLTSEGMGVGRIEGLAIFVEGALPGETVEVRIIKLKKSYGYGKLIRIIEQSPNRTEPVCTAYGRCGGCTLQHLTYQSQLAYKQKRVTEDLRRLGGINEPKVRDIIGMDDPLHYRNKAAFPVRRVNGKLVIGFFASNSHRAVEAGFCPIQHPANSQIIEIIRAFIEKYNLPAYDEERHHGLIRHIVTRVGYASGEKMVCIVINGRELPHADELVKALREIDGMSCIALSFNRERTNVILGRSFRTLWGKNYISDTLDGIKFRISPASFYQVNPVQTAKLYREALEAAELRPTDTVLDAYCGIGTISLYMARHCKTVMGVEIATEAIRDAKQNADLNNIDNAEFVTGAAEQIIPERLREGYHLDVAVVDPPRKGCDESLLHALAEAAPRTIVYVSCNPGTLARDAKILTVLGYSLEFVQPVDMFPQTSGVECVAKFVLQK